MRVLAALIAAASAAAVFSEVGNWSAPPSDGIPPPPPICTNLTGCWCCEDTSIVQTGNVLITNASYGTGQGVVAYNFILMIFVNSTEISNATATVDAACSVITWSTGSVWTRDAKLCAG